MSNGSRDGNDTLYLFNGSTTNTLATLSTDFFTNIAVNDSGTAVASTTGHKLYLASNGTLTPLLGNNSPFSEVGKVAINDSGEIAFFADLSAGGSGIFTGTDPVLDKVVETGDALAGSTITALGFSSDGLNNLGQIVFWARLANGEQGDFIATVPEPSAATVFLSLAVIASARRRTARGKC